MFMLTAFPLNWPRVEIGLRSCLAAMLMLGWVAWARGETRVDPTIPPPVWLALQPNVTGNAALVNQDASSGLQMILVGRTRRFAMIDGQFLKRGETYNGSKVLDIKSSEVSLDDASKSLQLTPSVEKRVVMPALRKKP